MNRTHRRAAVTGAALALVATTTAPALAQGPDATPARHRGLPAAARQPVQAALDQSVRELDQAGGVGVVAAATDGKHSYAAAAGVRDQATGTPARPTDRFRVGSITKTMVATVAMQLVDEGRLRLDTTVDEVLPGLLPGHGDITLEQLLSHRSGLPDFIAPLARKEVAAKLTPAQSEARTHTDRELIATALTEHVKAPGREFAYSNTNYLVIGQMLEKRTGRSMRDLLTERVFRKAGLTGTFYAGERWMPHDSLSEYLIAGPRTTRTRANATLFSSAGAVVSTPEDLNRFTRALMGGRLTSRASLEQMLRPRSTTPMRYGLGIYSEPDPCASPKQATSANPPLVYGHDGATFGSFGSMATTRDGRRAAAAGLSGRLYPPSDVKKQAAPNVAVVASMKAMCTP